MSIESRYNAGLRSYREKNPNLVTPDVKYLLRAIAAMIEHRPPKKKSAEPKLKVAPQFVYQTLVDKCSARMVLDTYNRTAFGRLGRTMQGISPAVTPEDVTHLANWVNAGNLSDFPVKPTFDHLVKHFVTWLARSREWVAIPKSVKPESLMR